MTSGCYKPAPDAGFIKTPELLKEDNAFPFQVVWIKEGAELPRYRQIYVAPVDTTHLLKMSWWDRFSFANTTTSMKPEVEVRVLAEYAQGEIKNAFKDNQSVPYTLVDIPQKDALCVELSLVEVVPTKVWLNSLSYVIAGALDTGSTAVEGRFRDCATQEVLFRFKDRRAGPYSIVNVKDLLWYGHAKRTIEDWADEIVRVCQKQADGKVSAPFPFTLKPW